MKTVGLLGGMSWESTSIYYRLINQGIRQRCGGLHSAKILLYSVDFAEIELLQSQGRWQEAGVLLGEAARRLETAGAELLLICTNTMHKVADQIKSGLGIKLLHIADATGRAIAADGLDSVGLLGTRFTMEERFYRSILEERYGLRVSIPAPDERAAVDSIIFNELCVGSIQEASRRVCQKVVQNLGSQGCQAIILGCTEIPLLLSADAAGLPLYDTTAIHAEQAVKEMLG
jgi:aspartate racemase